jgi:NADPH-dependent 2,4-dienoyl-CoA reductase/sulfur reductase-like enzyme
MGWRRGAALSNGVTPLHQFGAAEFGSAMKCLGSMTKHVAMTKRVVIVGGGIAGLALAIALSRRGIAATLVERQARWEPLSSGLFIYSDGLAALDKLSVLDGISASGWVSSDGGNLYLTAAGNAIERV